MPDPGTVDVRRSDTGGRVVAVPLPPGLRVADLAFTPDGTKLILADPNGMPLALDLRTLRRELAEFGPDWDLPPYPPAPTAVPPPIRVEVAKAGP
jgi:hypothetical protein